jgi:truncated hemoglobin YjbI
MARKQRTHDEGRMSKAQERVLSRQAEHDYIAAVAESRARIELGSKIHRGAEALLRNLYGGHMSAFPKPTTEDIEGIGGHKVFLAVFTQFYTRLQADPVLKTLFNESAQERPARQHGELLGSFVLRLLGHPQAGYARLLRQGKGHGLGMAHARAKGCPHRPASQRGRGFTWDQAHAWLGNMHGACDDLKLPESFRDSLVNYLAVALRFYGPMIHA